LPKPAQGAMARVSLRIARTRGVAMPHTAAPRPWLVGGLVLSAMAAGVAFGLRVATDSGEAEAPGNGLLDSEQVWAVRRLDGVDLSYRGAGTVAGTDTAPRIDWLRGTLNVDVVTGRGLDMRVQTREADIRVVGTGFTVLRDAFGTRVEVRHGVVETRCGSDDPVFLAQGDSVTCAPRTAAGLLGRALSLQESGAGASAVLATVEDGLRLTTLNDPVGAELGALQLQLFAEAGRTSDALVAAHALLDAGGGARHEEIVVLAGAVARSAGGCERAAPWLLEAGEAARAACSVSPSPD